MNNILDFIYGQIMLAKDNNKKIVEIQIDNTSFNHLRADYANHLRAGNAAFCMLHNDDYRLFNISLKPVYDRDYRSNNQPVMVKIIYK